MNGAGDMSAYYNTHAINLDSKGYEADAITHWELSSRMDKPYSAYANLSLAGKYYERDDIRKAIYYLNKIPNHSFAVASKYELLGDIMVKLGQTEDAISVYKKSLEFNSGQRKTRLKLAKAYEKTDSKKASEEYKQLEYISSFYDHLTSK